MEELCSIVVKAIDDIKNLWAVIGKDFSASNWIIRICFILCIDLSKFCYIDVVWVLVSNFCSSLQSIGKFVHEFTYFFYFGSRLIILVSLFSEDFEQLDQSMTKTYPN